MTLKIGEIGINEILNDIEIVVLNLDNISNFTVFTVFLIT